MKLILNYTVSDGCTYSAEVTYPVEYESAESFYEYFVEGLKAAVREQRSFLFSGVEFYTHEFFRFLDKDEVKQYRAKDYLRDMLFETEHGVYAFDAPLVLTVEEWFERDGLKQQ